MKKMFFFTSILLSLLYNANSLNVSDFGANGKDDKDDTVAFQKCVDRLVDLGGGKMIIPYGKYYISRLTFFGKKYSNITIIGNNSEIRQVFPEKRKTIERWNTFSNVNAADGCFIFDAKVSKQFNDHNSLKNIKISNLHFISDVIRLGFDELSHQISAHGVSGFSVENSTFTGFLGDGIAINAGTDFTENYGAYNKDVKIINCKFDGLNKENRQGISFYYCDGFLVENCSFKNITREDMPGAIDVEPMDNWQVSRNGIIRNCSFENIGGIGAVVLFLMDKTTENPTKSSYGYVVENCKFRNVRTPLAVIGHDNFLKYDKNEYNIIFRNSTVNDYVRIIDARKAYGVFISNIKFNNVKFNFKNLFGEKNVGKNIFFEANAFNNYLSDDEFFFSKNSENIYFKNSILKKKR